MQRKDLDHTKKKILKITNTQVETHHKNYCQTYMRNIYFKQHQVTEDRVENKTNSGNSFASCPFKL